MVLGAEEDEVSECVSFGFCLGWIIPRSKLMPALDVSGIPLFSFEIDKQRLSVQSVGRVIPEHAQEPQVLRTEDEVFTSFYGILTGDS